MTYTYCRSTPRRCASTGAVRSWSPVASGAAAPCARASASRVVFPIMATRFGAWDWLAGRASVPMRKEEGSAGLLYDCRTREAVRCRRGGEHVFHVVRARTEAGTVTVLGCHVHGFGLPCTTRRRRSPSPPRST